MDKSYEKVFEDLNFCSNRIGEQLRTICVGVLAMAWLFLSGGTDKPILPAPVNVNTMLLAGSLAILALVTDYFQYLFGYFNSKKVLDTSEGKNSKEATYNYKSLIYRLRAIFFWQKQVLAISSIIVLFIGVIKALKL